MLCVVDLIISLLVSFHETHLSLDLGLNTQLETFYSNSLHNYLFAQKNGTSHVNNCFGSKSVFSKFFI